MQPKQYQPTTPSELHEAGIFMEALCEVSAGHMTNLVRGYLAQDDPDSAAAAIFQTISIPLARLSESDWQRIMREGANPCGKNGCTCHEVKAGFFRATDAVRRKQIEVNRAHAPQPTQQPRRRTDG